jgi:hypothetical protein
MRTKTICLSLFCGCLLASGAPRTFYIDYASGSDANNGTATGTPWKHCPGMEAFSGTYAHQAGDRFIFKGGVTWPIEALPMYIENRSGNSANWDYYGADSNWFSGGSWTRPVFDAEGQKFGKGLSPHSTSRGNVMWFKNCDYVQVDLIEMKNFQWYDPVSTSFTDCFAVYFESCDNVIASHLYIHDWVVRTTADSRSCGVGQFNSNGTIASNLVVVAPTEIDGEWITDTGGGRTSGTGVTSFSIVDGCEIVGTTMGIWGGNIVRNNVVRNTGNSFNSGTHENGIWFQNDGSFYNNVFHSIGEGVGAFFLPGWGNRSNRKMYIYNNVFYNLPQINLSNEQNPDESNELWFFNNVVMKTGSCIDLLAPPSKSGDPFGKLRVQNNLFIISPTSAAIKTNDASRLGSDYIIANNVSITPTEATALGLTTGNLFKPSAVIAALVDQGASFAALTTEDREGTTRPVGTDWDIGPYEFTEETPNPGNVFFSAAVYSVDEDGTSITITATRSGGSQGAVDVDFHTLDDTALAGTDYTTNSGTLSWADEELGNKTFNVSITDNGDEDGNRAFNVLLTNATGSLTIISPSNSVVTIVDDDDDGSEVPLMPSLTFEAEAGLVESPLTEDTGAIKQTVQTTDPDLGGRARYRVTIPDTGQYIVKMEVEAESTAADSLFVEFDEEPTSPSDIWDVQTLTSGFEERTVSHRGLGTFDDPDENPKIWTLSAGEHTLYIRGREANKSIDTITIEAVAGSVPAAPSDLQVTPISTSQIDLDWTDNASDEDGFYIEADDGSGFVRIGTNTANDVTFSATGLASSPSGVQYTFRVQSFNANGVSEYCDPVADFTEAAPEQQLRFFLPIRIAASE